MKKRGAALPTILALITVVLVAGLAMGSLSALSLQFNQRQLQRHHSELAARSALAVFLARVHEHDASRSETEQLNPMVPAPFDVNDILDNGLEHEENGYKVSLHFDRSREGHSTDNSTGEVEVQGWPDDDGVARVPAFTLDLIFKVEGGRGVQYYRAILKKVWPYAVFSAIGPVTLMGNPEDGTSYPGRSSKVKGDLYTQWRSQEGGGHKVVGYGLGPINEPSDLLANLEARQGYHQDIRRDRYPLRIGATVGRNPDIIPNILTDISDEETVFLNYEEDQLPHELGDTDLSWNFSVPIDDIQDGGHNVDGDFFINYDGPLDIYPYLGSPANPNTFDGEVRLRRGLVLDPLYYYRQDKDAEFTFNSSGYQEVDFDPIDHSAEFEFGLPDTPLYDSDEPHLLSETLELSPDKNSTGGSPSTHYRIEGSVSNRQVFYSEAEKKLCIKENYAGLKLQDTVLYVKGDLDLGADHFEDADGNPKPIEVLGSGATLIVDGKLILGNAHFDAVDQGFVIFAEDIVLTGSGEFRGLMIASNSINILSRDDSNPLTITGALMCGGFGGIVLRGTTVNYEPRYLKAVNGGGDFYLHSWQKIR